jgi:hypothetical protein
VLTSLASRRRQKNLALYLCIAAGGIPALALMIAVVTSLSGGSPVIPPSARPIVDGPLGSFSWCIPPRAQWLASIHTERVSRNGGPLLTFLAEICSRSDGKRGPSPPSMLKLAPFFQILTEFHVACSRDREAIVVFRSKDDLSVEEVSSRMSFRASSSPSPSHPSPGKTFRGIPYAPIQQGFTSFVAKIAPNTFCSADRERDLHDALTRWEQGEVPLLDATLRSVWDNTQGDVRVVFLHPGSSQGKSPLEMPGFAGTAAPSSEPEWVSLGLTLDANLSFLATGGFCNEAEARKYETEAQEAMRAVTAKIAEFEGLFRTAPPERQAQGRAIRELFRKVVQLSRTLQISRDGDRVLIGATWTTQDVEEALRQAVLMGPT